MKRSKVFLGFGLIFILAFCQSERQVLGDQTSYCYIERTFSFFDPYDVGYADGRHQGYTYDMWIRQPENMRMVHETFKKIGYHNLISEYQLTANPCLFWGYRNRPLNEMIDSLILTFPLDSVDSKFYREFWARRVVEGNEIAVFEILKEASDILISHKRLDYDSTIVNDTLFRLVQIGQIDETPSKSRALDHFNYLKEIGMHASAYNVLFESKIYEDIDWDREVLKRGLIPADSNHCPNPWVVDNTK